jgi:SET domain-containing protein
MLLVKTQIKESKIPKSGLGCFAGEFIPKGTKIWEFTPNLDRIYSVSEMKEISGTDLEFLKKYSYRNNSNYYLCVDNARFINHSFFCNTREDKNEQATYTTVDIQEGDEILSDYTQFGVNQDDLLHNCSDIFAITDFDIPYSC